MSIMECKVSPEDMTELINLANTMDTEQRNISTMVNSNIDSFLNSNSLIIKYNILAELLKKNRKKKVIEILNKDYDDLMNM